MKKTIIISLCSMMLFGALSCGTSWASTSIFGSAKSSGTTNGVACGAALKSLYTQYKADGKIDTKNLSNIVNLATLANGIESLKGQSDKSAFYKDFATGLITGSGNLVTGKTASSVTSTLSSLGNLDLSALGDVAAAVTGNAAGTSASASSNKSSALGNLLGAAANGLSQSAGNSSSSASTSSAASSAADAAVSAAVSSAASSSAASAASSALSELTSALGSNKDVNTAVSTISSLLSSFGK